MLKPLVELFRLLPPKHKRWLLGLILLMAGAAVAEAGGITLIVPFIALIADPEAMARFEIVQRFFETFGATDQSSRVALAAGLLVGVFVLKNAYLAIVLFVQETIVVKLQVALGRRLFEHYMSKPYLFHVATNSATLLRNVHDEVRIGFTHVVIPVLIILVEFFVLVAIGVVLAIADFTTSLAAAGFVLLIGGAFYASVHRKSAILGQRQQDAAGEMIQWVQEGLTTIKESKLLGRESYFVDRFVVSAEKYAGAMRFARFVVGLPRHVMEVLGAAGLLGITVLLFSKGRDGQQVLPLIGLYGMAAMRLMPSSTRIIAAMTNVRHHMPSVIAITTGLADATTTPRASVAADPLPRGALEVEHLAFSYPGTNQPTLRDVSLRVDVGDTVAIVGSSGAGKTTLVDVVLGLLEPDGGDIRVGGQTVFDNLRSWQDRVGYITQQVHLIDASIRNNVAFCIPEAEIDDEALERALRNAELWDFVQTLPDGVHTVVGEDGTRLSGGQRQRIGIARALYHDPEVLVLDEATSALDPETERLITDAINALRGHKTVVIIAHRLSTIQDADRIVMMVDGLVEHIAPYDELVERSTAFAAMVQAAARRTESKSLGTTVDAQKG